MNAFSCCVCLVILILLPWHLQYAFADNSSYVPSDNIALNCGSNSSQLIQFDGRNWTGDQNESFHNPRANSLIAQVPFDVESIPKVPYMTARIFRSQFIYKFNLTPGPKFIRLHFYPVSYLGLDISESFLSVTCGKFTLLHNFSAYLTAEFLNSTYYVKEFIIHVSGATLELTFSPMSNVSGAYAFVNGIEVVSMPPNLYIRGENAPIPLVGHHSVVLYIHNDSALETLHRVDVAGNEIPPKYDTGMFRTWSTDDAYFFGADLLIYPWDVNMSVIYPANVPPYTAPENVYRSARTQTLFNNGVINLNYNLTFLFPVDTGFNYLVRLHLCEIDPEIKRINERVFTIFLNNETAEEGVDVIALGGGPGVAVYEDFVVMIPKTKEGKQDLWLDLYPYARSKPLYYCAILNGAEVFKISTADGNLAGLNPLNSKSKSTVHQVTDKKPKRNRVSVVIIIPSVLGAVTLSLLFISYLIVKRFEMIKGKCRLLVPFPNRKSKRANDSCFCHLFSIEKIKLATNDLDDALVIGSGGFGKVYKGSFDGGATWVAIKRGNPMSEQGAIEFETEIRMLCEVRHKNLVSLLGYCQEDGELILVYDFMAGGTLHDRLHLSQQSSQDPPLSWIQRLEICIGVARGLHYLHTGTEHRIIHRDIKTSNILLDHNFVAKISDFGFSKASYPTISSTNVKGSVGYLDPEYYRCQNLTEKSDVYSFGVVLMEVLSAKPAVAEIEDEQQCGNLVDWALLCCERGCIDQLVDTSLYGKIAAESLERYVEVAEKCLAEKGVDRPSMGDVMQGLVLALQLEKNDQMGKGNLHEENSDLTPGIEFSDIINPIGR